ncbi:MAG: hypothetical protein SOZ62_02600 [Eubacteriales bacterium]|nr:hypothetical protein [Eubacteriales bacterium]
MKKSKFITLILMITVTAALLMSTVLSVCADGVPEANSSSKDVSSENNTQLTEQAAENTSDNEADNAGSDDEVASRSLRNALTEHMGEIIGSVTLVLTAVVAILYKRGLLPSVANAVSAINASAGNAINKMCAYAQSTDQAMTKLSSDMVPISDAVADFSTKYSALLSDVASVTDKMKTVLSSEENLKQLISMQCEILYSVFMSASIPQYQKDYLGKIYTQIKLLTENTTDKTHNTDGVSEATA